MKAMMRMLAVATIVVATTIAVNAQNNNTKLNGNYKHRYPVSKGNTLKSSFENNNPVDMSVRNYKKAGKYNVTERSAFKYNFDNIQKVSKVNSKHPYGL